MKKIYVVLTCTGTILSNIIKYYTHDEYTHSSISLDKNLEELYSFGRLNPYNAFRGGFVHEGIDFGTFKRFYKTKAVIYEIPVEDDEYKKMVCAIDNVASNKKEYKFNVFGLFLVAIRKKFQMKNSFYCAEFVKYILETGVGKIEELPNLIKPEDFKKLKNKNIIYEGLLKNYKKEC